MLPLSGGRPAFYSGGVNVAGSATIGAERDRVWAALRDPRVLARTIPGCERLEEAGPDTYRVTVSAGVASLKGLYEGEVTLTEPSEPDGFVLRARGQGAPGTVDATVRVRLSEVDGGTRVDYDADAVIGGMIGGVGQRMLTAVARRTAGEFFTAVADHLRAPEPAPAGVPASMAPTGQPAAPTPPAVPVTPPAPPMPVVYERPAKAPVETRPWVMLAAFGMGAGVALGSAAVGWLFGRGRR